MTRRLLGRAAAFWLAVLLVAGVAPDVAAISPDGACTGSFSVTFSPALTNQPQTASLGDDYTYNCTIGAQSGGSDVTFNVPSVSCLNVLSTIPPVDEVVTWTGGAGGTTSTIHYTAVEVVGLSATLTGSVTSGRFAGDAAVKVLTATGIQGGGIPFLCPVGLGTFSQVSGIAVLTITDPEL